MSLLQIQEPDAPPNKTDLRLALGIDLGTTNSLVAIINDNGQAETLPDEKGRMIMPSLVRYDKDGRVTVGEEARIVDNGNAKSVIASVKRLMGRAAKEVGDDYRYEITPPKKVWLKFPPSPVKKVRLRCRRKSCAI